MSKLKSALALARRGFFVFPVEANGKRPVHGSHGYKDATRRLETIEAWWKENPNYNIAIYPAPSGHVVIDVDVKDNGQDTWANMEIELGLPLSTMEVDTPSGGRHYYYRLPDPDRPVKSTIRQLGPGLDVRCAGGYVVAPGSEIDGKSYVELDPQAFPLSCDVAKAPTSLMARLMPAALDPPAISTTDVELDLKENLIRAGTWLADHAGPAIEYHGGNDHTYRTAAKLRDFSISEDEALRLMLIWNELCEPPWNPDELTEIVIHAYRYGNREMGGEALGDPAEVFAGIKPLPPVPPTAPEDPETNKFILATLTDTEIDAMPDPQYLIDDTLIQGSIALIYGPQNSYKSFIALDMALCLATGEPWAGKTIPHPQEVLYVSGEGSTGIKKRRAAWRTTYNVPTLFSMKLTTIVPLFGYLTEVEEFSAALAKLQPNILIIDTLALAMAGMDENSAKDAGLIASRLKHLAREHALEAIILIHHTGKDEGRGSRGSTSIPAGCDMVLRVSRPRDMEVLVYMEKQKDAEQWSEPLGLRATKVGDSLVFKPARDVAPGLAASQRQVQIDAAKAVLMQATGPISTKMLAEEVAARLNPDPDEKYVSNLIAYFRRTYVAEGRPGHAYVVETSPNVLLALPEKVLAWAADSSAQPEETE